MKILLEKIIFLVFLVFSTTLVSGETADKVATYPGDLETSIMMALDPNNVKMKRAKKAK